MISHEGQLKRMLARRLISVGLDPTPLFRQASEIIVFGSRAVGVHSRDSDLDVLVVGGVGKLKGKGLDMIRVAPDHVKTPEWLESELAAHVASYGVWLSGS